MNSHSASSGASAGNQESIGTGEQYVGRHPPIYAPKIWFESTAPNGSGSEPYYYFQVPPVQLPSQQQQFNRLQTGHTYAIPQPQAHQAHTLLNHGQHQAPAQHHLQTGNLTGPIVPGSQPHQKRKEIYRYPAPFDLYAMGWSCKTEPQFKFRLAIGSFIEEYNNKISIIQLHEDQGEFSTVGTFEHPYPVASFSLHGL